MITIHQTRSSKSLYMVFIASNGDEYRVQHTSDNETAISIYYADGRESVAYWLDGHRPLFRALMNAVNNIR